MADLPTLTMHLRLRFRVFILLILVSGLCLLNNITVAEGVAAAQTPAPLSAPPLLATLKTILVPLDANSFLMGTDLAEATRAIHACEARDVDICQLDYAKDSFPVHRVFIKAFAIEKYEVTTQQYVAFLNTLGPNTHLAGCAGMACALTLNQQEFSHLVFDGARYSALNVLFNARPITFVTWYGADAFCKAIGRRLPTEAEWEFAARGGQARNIFPWGNFWDPKQDPNRALTSHSRRENQLGPSAVTAFPAGATATGIFNMAGNVSEWVADWYDADYYGNTPVDALDPQGPANSPISHKVLRGGDWDSLSFFARTVHRRDADTLDARATLGFRCVSGEPASISSKRR